MVMLIFVVFEDEIRYTYFLAIVVFSILYVLFISMYLTFIYILYLLRKKEQTYE
jgi:NADH:ubiquinone oxidoreductase subunit 3 (subunit A)